MIRKWEAVLWSSHSGQGILTLEENILTAHLRASTGRAGYAVLEDGTYCLGGAPPGRGTVVYLAAVQRNSARSEAGLYIKIRCGHVTSAASERFALQVDFPPVYAKKQEVPYGDAESPQAARFSRAPVRGVQARGVALSRAADGSDLRGAYPHRETPSEHDKVLA